MTMKINRIMAVLLLAVATAFAQHTGGGGSGTGGGGGNTCGTPICTVSTAGSGNGVLALSGNTSGTATLTAPAVAGTSTNPILISNSIQLPTGTAFNWNADVGLSRVSAAVVGIGNGTAGDFSGTLQATFFLGAGGGHTNFYYAGNSDTVALSSSTPLLWSSTAEATGTRDVGITRSAAKVLSFDDGTFNSGLGSFTNCRIFVNVTPVTVNANVSTDQNLMAATIPANCMSTVGRTMRIWIAGVYSTPAASTSAITLKVKLCSVSGCGSGNVATLVNIVSTAIATLQVTNNAFNSTVWSTTQTAGAASRSEDHGLFAIDLGASNATADSIFNDTNTATVAGSPADIDYTAQNFLQVTIAASVASGSNSFTQRQLIVDSIL